VLVDLHARHGGPNRPERAAILCRRSRLHIEQVDVARSAVGPERSLEPGKIGALKTRPDGTVIDGHHRIVILRERGVDVDQLPREVLAKL
jgi:hypothetical protein